MRKIDEEIDKIAMRTSEVICYGSLCLMACAIIFAAVRIIVKLVSEI